MSIVGAGGVKLTLWRKMRRFHKEYDCLDISMRDRVDECLQKLTTNPIPSGLRFEKLKGYHDPDVYTIHVTGNYKISFEISKGVAYLRRVASHDAVDRAP